MVLRGGVRRRQAGRRVDGQLIPDSTRVVYEGTHLGVTIEVWNGREREIVERDDVVAIVPIDRDGRVTLVRQLRPSASRRLLEIPAGRIEPGEELLASAMRELTEETGLRRGSWRRGPSFWTTPGFCRERVHLFFAEELEPGAPAPEEGEELELERIPGGEVRLRLGEIEDGKTLVGLLLYLADSEILRALSPAASDAPGTIRRP
jgi:ADP-ribose pyrophosphatase